jgi:hypothetical protein
MGQGLHLADLHLLENAGCGDCRSPHVHVCPRDGNANQARAKTKHPWYLEDGVIRGGLVQLHGPDHGQPWAPAAAWMRDTALLVLTHARVPEHCRICGHRPAIRGASLLCARHQLRWKKARRKAGGSGFEEWLTVQVPYDSYGGCRVVVCPEPAYSPLGLCHGHESAYRLQGYPGGARLPEAWFGRFEQAGRPVPVCYDDQTAFGRWCQAALPLPRPGTVNLRGLTPLARAEIQWGLHAHAQAAEHAGWALGWVQAIRTPAAAWTAWPTWTPAGSITPGETRWPRCSPRIWVAGPAAPNPGELLSAPPSRWTGGRPRR